MSRLLGGIGIVVLVVVSLGFAYLNSGHRVTLRLGTLTLYDVPLTVVVFGSVIVGMIIMLLAGIRSDLKVRRILRARLAEEDRQERERFIDASQQDLFADEGRWAERERARFDTLSPTGHERAGEARSVLRDVRDPKTSALDGGPAPDMTAPDERPPARASTSKQGAPETAPALTEKPDASASPMNEEPEAPS